jgi:predicted transcriptional regulator
MKRRPDMHTDNKPITSDDIKHLIHAIQHPVIQSRPIDPSAERSQRDYATLARRLRTLFEVVPDASDAAKRTNYV